MGRWLEVILGEGAEDGALGALNEDGKDPGMCKFLSWTVSLVGSSSG